MDILYGMKTINGNPSELKIFIRNGFGSFMAATSKRCIEKWKTIEHEGYVDEEEVITDLYRSRKYNSTSISMPTLRYEDFLLNLSINPTNTWRHITEEILNV